MSKAIDKEAGAKREVIGITSAPNGKDGGYEGERYKEKRQTPFGVVQDQPDRTAPVTDAAKQWQGWGTALKPAVEYIIVAQKPLTLSALCDILAQKIGGALCQLSLYVKDAEKSSALNLKGQSEDAGFALWSAVEKCNILADLFDLMDMLPSESETPSSLNIGLLWLNTLAAISQAESMFTTEMVTSLTIDLRTLNSSSSMNTADSIIEVLIKQHGTELNASLAESIFNVVNAKLASILTPSAPGLATLKDGSNALRPDWRPVILARKPIEKGLTVAQNVQKWGTGALNIDGCRIGYVDDADKERAHQNALGPVERFKTSKRIYGGGKQSAGFADTHSTKGRWPANLILSYPEDEYALRPDVTEEQRRELEGWLNENS